MITDILFPFSQYWTFYLGFLLFVFVVLIVDLGLFHKTPHEVSFREASYWSIVWVILALLFSVFFYYYSLNQFNLPQYEPFLTNGITSSDLAYQSVLEFLTGYIVEKSLAIDNIFVFVVIFNFFSIPLKYQHRVLFFGILGALIFRGIFIAAGSMLMSYHLIVLLFGAFLIFTGIKIFFSEDKQINPENNKILKFLNKYLPIASKLEGQSFFLRDNNKIVATPLFVTLLFIEISDVVFAFDSVPAIFAITKEPLIVFTSNIFAILGLRAMYFLLASVVDKFYMLKYGLGIVLVFVGLKMIWLNDLFGGEFPIGISLFFIVFVIGSSVVLSLTFPKSDKKA